MGGTIQRRLATDQIQEESLNASRESIESYEINDQNNSALRSTDNPLEDSMPVQLTTARTDSKSKTSKTNSSMSGKKVTSKHRVK